MSRTIRLATAAAVALTAACNDAPSAPALAPADAPSQALAIVPLATLTLTLPQLTEPKSTIPTVRFTSFTGRLGTVRSVKDNSADDLDPRYGYLKVTIAKSAKYEARVVSAPAYLFRDDAVRVVSSTASTVDLGAITMKVNPTLWIVQQTGTLPITPAAGGAFMISRDGQNLMLVEDDGVNDQLNVTPGSLQVTLHGVGTYQFCETLVPTGFKALPGCVSITTGTWGSVTQQLIIRVK